MSINSVVVLASAALATNHAALQWVPSILDECEHLRTKASYRICAVRAWEGIDAIVRKRAMLERTDYVRTLLLDGTYHYQRLLEDGTYRAKSGRWWGVNDPKPQIERWEFARNRALICQLSQCDSLSMLMFLLPETTPEQWQAWQLANNQKAHVHVHVWNGTTFERQDAPNPLPR